MSTNLKSAMPSGLPSGLPPGLANINIDPSPFTSSFSGDFLGLPIPDDDQLWGLSPVSPMATAWDKPDSAAFANSALERDLKNAQVRNGQPTPPPYDDQGPARTRQACQVPRAKSSCSKQVSPEEEGAYPEAGMRLQGTVQEERTAYRGDCTATIGDPRIEE